MAITGEWTSLAAPSLTLDALALVANLPVLGIISSVHMICDFTLRQRRA
jgi:acetoacetate decarboxylase